ncbi:galactokinase [Rubripirellula reticaptiva]|uniref:Galactokinase n=1 Tax=Rubripirellula reticaptiva TaxID=2528013 RepID=A0A5C6F6A4_9BACT|nr:galactokinase [Rubripirellula reticaptiva]TWU56064.1 Galactokinase [Rubripirellula reticaptiva]
MPSNSLNSTDTTPAIFASADDGNDAASRYQATVEQHFQSQYGRPATVVVSAPGRVNLIGEHIDYNDGYVLPLAIERSVVIAAAPAPENGPAGQANLYSMDLAESAVIRLDQELQPGSESWVRYVEGVLDGFRQLGVEIPAFDAIVGSTVPLGSGLSSSAALEVATATLLEQLTGRTLGQSEKALLCQKAEHDYAGVPCGIMDQFSSVFGKENELMLIDCCSETVEGIPFNASDVSVLITNSNVKHALVNGEYAARRSQCESALKKLGKTSWRDVTLADVEQANQKDAVGLNETEFRRARHVVTEIHRTLKATDAFRNSDWELAGELLYASHDSLRDDYDVSCPELDILVEIARDIGGENGVYGSRMTGGGFGGCTVSLVANEHVDAVIATITTSYESKTGIKPTCFSSRPARGAHVVKG